MPLSSSSVAQVSGIEKRRSRKGTPRQSLPPDWLSQLQFPAQTAVPRRKSAPARQEPPRAAAAAGSAIAAQPESAKHATGIAQRAQVLAQRPDRTTGGAQRPAPSPQPSRRLLAAKLLSSSDATKGRVVMPAADVAAHFPAWLQQPARG